MNVLTTDIISLIAKRDCSIVKHEIINAWSMVILYRDQNGKYHRINGPAKIWDFGNWAWYFHGKLHRGKIPSVKIGNFYMWHIMGKCVAELEK